jgi:hypothetical protein
MSFRIVALVLLVVGAVSAQGTRVDPERILTGQFQFTSKDLGQARQGQPVVKVKVEGDELGLIGAIRLPGKKERLSEWVRNIEHFRRSAELGTAQIVATPPTAAAFAGLTLGPGDLDEVRRCAAEKCAIRLSADALARLRQGADPNDTLRGMLLDDTVRYLKSGNTGISAAFADDTRRLTGQARSLTALSPELVTWLDGFPAASLTDADHLVYWSAMPAGSASMVTLHHLVVYRRGPGETWIADKSLYSSRYFDAGVLVLGLYDAADGAGFYAVAGSRMKSSQLSGVAGTVLRRQIQRSASDTVKTYLEWMRDSLAAAS